jgi:opacity protein-like surface antigen
LGDVRASTGAKLLIALAWSAALCASAAAAADCTAEETALMKDESELPRLEVASPADRPITCITLETNIAFASRLKAHVAHCPASSYAQTAAEWEKTRADYAARFTLNRCKRTF